MLLDTKKEYILYDDISKDRKYWLWRRSVYKRDNYMCKLCGRRGVLNAHHIKRRYDHPELSYKVKNGITLCASTRGRKGCHEIITGHEKEWESFLSEIVNGTITIRKIKNFIKRMPSETKRIIPRLSFLLKRQQKLEANRRKRKKR